MFLASCARPFGGGAFCFLRHTNSRLIPLGDTCRMRKLIWIVGILALASSLDSYHYDGFYTRSVPRMLTEIGLGMKLIG